MTWSAPGRRLRGQALQSPLEGAGKVFGLWAEAHAAHHLNRLRRKTHRTFASNRGKEKGSVLKV
jgi:hypothetical protein